MFSHAMVLPLTLFAGSAEPSRTPVAGPLVLAVGLAFVGVLIGVYVLVMSRVKNLSLWNAALSVFSLLWFVPAAAALLFVGATVVYFFRGGGAEVPEAVSGSTAEVPEAIVEPDDLATQPGVVAVEGTDRRLVRMPPDATMRGAAFRSDPSHPGDAAGNSLSDVPTDDGPLPAWVKATPAAADSDSYVVAVSSKQYLSPEQAEQEAMQQAAALVHRRFDAHYGRKGSWTIPQATVGTDAVRQKHLEKVVRDLGPMAENVAMYRAHLQLDVSPSTLKHFYPEWRRQIVEHRLWAYGGLFAMLTLVFGTSSAYFRLDRATGGAYRRRLKLAAVSLITAGGIAVGTLLPVVS